MVQELDHHFVFKHDFDSDNADMDAYCLSMAAENGVVVDISHTSTSKRSHKFQNKQLLGMSVSQCASLDDLPTPLKHKDLHVTVMMLTNETQVQLAQMFPAGPAPGDQA